jgi:hypothetical protein
VAAAFGCPEGAVGAWAGEVEIIQEAKNAERMRRIAQERMVKVRLLSMIGM